MKSRRQFIRQGAWGFLGLPYIRHAHQALPTLQDIRLADNDEVLYKLIRKSLLIPADRVYLNTGSLGPSPRQILDRVMELMHELESNPVGNNWGPLGQKMEAVRQQVAGFIGAEVEEIVLTRNTTEGINLIGTCLSLEPGDEILTTDHEHGGGENGLKYLVGTKGATLRKIEMPLAVEDEARLVDYILGELREKTQVLMLSHVSTLTGLRMPLEKISQATRSRGIVLIADGAQAPGHIPVNVGELGVDFYASSGHKWLLGPKETGFLYVRKGMQPQFDSVFTQGSFNAYSAASGTRNVATVIGLGEVLDWHTTIGVSKIESRCLELASYCSQKLQELDGIRIISPRAKSLQTGMVSISLEKLNNRDVFEALKAQDIIIKVLPKFNALRFSCHMFNTQKDIHTMVDALAEVLEKG